VLRPEAALHHQAAIVAEAVHPEAVVQEAALAVVQVAVPATEDKSE